MEYVYFMLYIIIFRMVKSRTVELQFKMIKVLIMYLSFQVNLTFI